MPELKIGIQLAAIRQPIRKALPIAASLGVSAVELDARGELRPQALTRTGIRQLCKLFGDYQLRVAAISFQTRRGYHVDEDLDRRVEATRQAMRLAADLGASVVVNQLNVLPAADSGEDWSRLVGVLTDLGSFGHRVGATFAIRTGALDGEALAPLLEALPANSIGVELDPAELILHSHSPLETVQAIGGSVIHVHARDAVRDLSQGRDIEVPLGGGSAEFPQLLGELEQHRYRGYYTVSRHGGDDPLYEMGQAVKFLKRL